MLTSTRHGHREFYAQDITVKSISGAPEDENFPLPAPPV